MPEQEDDQEQQLSVADQIVYSVTHQEGGSVTLTFFGHLNGEAAGIEASVVTSVDLPAPMVEGLIEQLRSRSR